MRIIGKIAVGSFAAGMAYVVTLYASFAAYGALYGPWDRDRALSGLLIGLAVATLPYAV